MARSLRLLGIALVGSMVIASVSSLFDNNGSSSTSEEKEEESRRPNFLVILTDDQRASGTLEVMPITREAFAQEGVRYSKAFATTPVCCPSRASIFTGEYAHNHGIRTNGDGDKIADLTTMQGLLQEAGWRTGLFGKYINSWSTSKDPSDFDRWAIHRVKGTGAYVGGTWNVQGSLRQVDEYSTDFVADAATKFLTEAEENDDQPWFLFLSLAAPHAPYLPGSSYAGSPVPEWRPGAAVGEGDRSDKPPHVRAKSKTEDEGSRLRKKQLRTLRSVDDLVGRVLTTLAEEDEDADTLAVFTSDNGFLWGEHKLVGKYHPYKESVRVPLMLRWPGELEEGTTDDRWAATIDIAPTFLSIADLDTGDMDGTSLVERSSRNHVFTEQFKSSSPVPDWAAIRTNRYHYVEYYGPGGELTFREFYWLEEDPSELENVLSDEATAGDPSPSALSTIQALLEKDKTCAGDNCP